VSSGGTAKFVWDYHVDNRNLEFSSQSPTWSFYTTSGMELVIALEDKFEGWKWKINVGTCPARLLNPTRVSKESTATLVITNVTTDDNGIYGCSLMLSTPITSTAQLIVTGNNTYIFFELF
jgi:hypothetical protein